MARISLKGVWPDRDHHGAIFAPSNWRGKRAGKALAGGWRGIVALYAADWEYYAKRLKVNKWSDFYICWDCSATLTGCDCFVRLDEDHSSVTARRPNDEFDEKWVPHKDLPGVHKDMLCRDFVHVAALGTMAHSSGSAIEELAQEGHFGNFLIITTRDGRPNARLRIAFKMFPATDRSSVL